MARAVDCTLPPALRAGLAADLAPFPLRSITHETFAAAQRADRRLQESDITAMFGIYNVQTAPSLLRRGLPGQPPH